MKKVLAFILVLGIAGLAFLMISSSAFKLTGNALWDWGHCSPRNPCPAGQGDCDTNADCLTGLCSQNVGAKYGQVSNMDVCEAKPIEGDDFDRILGLFSSEGVRSTGRIWLGVTQFGDTPIREIDGKIACSTNYHCINGLATLEIPTSYYIKAGNNNTYIETTDFIEKNSLIPCNQKLDLNKIEASGDWRAGNRAFVEYLCIEKINKQSPSSGGSGGSGGSGSGNAQGVQLVLSSDTPKKDQSLCGKAYVFELISASGTSATVKVTDSTGKSETREVTENSSKVINGVTIKVINADETNLKISSILEVSRAC